MFKLNPWKKNPGEFIIPKLPPELTGITGFLLKYITIDSSVGEEVVLFILDQPRYADQLASFKKIDLYAKPGVARTRAGMIAFILWTIKGPEGYCLENEHLLNPFNIDTIRLLSATGQQSHLKAFVVDSVASKVKNMFEFKNVFGLGKFASGISQVIGHETEGNFEAVKLAFNIEYTLEDLKRM